MTERLCFEERKDIEKYIEEGFSGNQISSILARSKNAINTEIRKNGGRDKYTAYKAQERSVLARKIHNKVVSEKLKGRPDSFGLYQRIIALENAIISLMLEVEKLKKSKT